MSRPRSPPRATLTSLPTPAQLFLISLLFCEEAWQRLAHGQEDPVWRAAWARVTRPQTFANVTHLLPSPARIRFPGVIVLDAVPLQKCPHDFSGRPECLQRRTALSSGRRSLPRRPVPWPLPVVLRAPHLTFQFFKRVVLPLLQGFYTSASSARKADSCFPSGPESLPQGRLAGPPELGQPCPG